MVAFCHLQCTVGLLWKLVLKCGRSGKTRTGASVMQSEIKKNADITASSEQAAKLKAMFPSCFDADGRFRPDKLEELLRADGADITREGYKLDWLGKSYARLLANLKTETLLAPNAEHNVKPENVDSQNLLIQGDNLDVLKHLVNAYSEKVKMIYIDPPYNTGSDGFVYSDNRKFTPEQLAGLAGIDEDEAKRILEFTASKSNSHSAWLTFMYPRLYIARELLCNDGAIFISIDDNEQAQLKLLCDEVFGEENFIGGISVQLNPRGRNLDKFIAKTHETVMVYVRDYSNDEAILGLPKTGKMLDEYNKEDERGKYRLTGLRNRNQAFNPTTRPKLFYPLYVNPSDCSVSIEANEQYTDKVEPITPDGIETCWTWGKEKVTAENTLLSAEKTGDEWRIFRKDYLYDEEGNIATTLVKSQWLDKSINNDHGRKEVKSLLGAAVMSFPKSVELIKIIGKIGSAQGDIVMDFFAGSGTTAQAVFELNQEEDLNRTFICVQIDEPTDEKSVARKSGFDTVFEVTHERILRAAEKVRLVDPDATCDFGFKEFKTIPANDGPFAHYLDDADRMEDYVPFDGMALDNEALNALLTTWKVFDGLPLHQDLAPIDLGGYTAHMGEHILYFAHKGLELTHITEMLRRIDEDDDFAPRKLVVFHHVFGDKTLREFSEAVNAPNRKHLELTFEQRF